MNFHQDVRMQSWQREKTIDDDLGTPLCSLWLIMLGDADTSLRGI
jgi:hypothetical protein